MIFDYCQIVKIVSVIINLGKYCQLFFLFNYSHGRKLEYL